MAANTRNRIVALALFMAALIFAFDLSMPLGVAGGVPYVAVVLLGLWVPKREHIVLLALLGTTLTVAGFILSPAGGIAWVVLVNRALALIAIWITAILLIHIKKHQEHILKLSVTDRLTGLFNRLKLDETYAYELERAKRYGHELSVILFDLDHFKKVNDTYGHPTGDAVLIRVAELAKNNIRASDTLGRWGGEEFMVICPETDLSGARAIAEKLRQAIAAHTFPKAGRTTASFGVSATRSGDHGGDLAKRADEALYRAKRGGRNRVEDAG